MSHITRYEQIGCNGKYIGRIWHNETEIFTTGGYHLSPESALKASQEWADGQEQTYGEVACG